MFMYFFVINVFWLIFIFKNYLKQNSPGVVVEMVVSACLCTMCFIWCLWGTKKGIRSPGTLSVDQVDLELTKIQLPLPPECWD